MAAGPVVEMTTRMRLQEALKVALSIVLFYWFALSMDWAMPKYGVLAIAVVASASPGASMRKGILRFVGTVIGGVLGFLLINLFAQNPIGLAFGMAALFVVLAYLHQTGTHNYMWFMAALVAGLVWAVGYAKIGYTFRFTFFRVLETGVGVAFFTLVSMLLWPIAPERTLIVGTRGLWLALVDLGHRLLLPEAGGQEEVEGVSETADVPIAKVQGQVAASVSGLEQSLLNYFAETWLSPSRRRALETLREVLEQLVESMEHLRPIQEDVRSLRLERHIPGLRGGLGVIQERLERFAPLWEGGAADSEGDIQLLEPLAFEIDADESLSPSHLAALVLYAEALESIDRGTRAVLRSLRVFAELDEPEERPSLVSVTALRRPPRWSWDRLQRASFAGLACLAGFFSWVYFQPPAGPALPVGGGLLGLLLAAGPVDGFQYLRVFIKSIWVFVAPFYLLVLPQLDSMATLLAAVFAFCFFVGWLGTRDPLLQVAALAIFALLTDINNHQKYNVAALLSITVLLFIVIVGTMILHKLLHPSTPVGALGRELKRFFRGCARVVSGYRSDEEGAQARATRRRQASFEVELARAPGELAALASQLGPPKPSEEEVRAVTSLIDDVQVVRLRLEALEYSYRLAAGLTTDAMSENDLPTRSRTVVERLGACSNVGRSSRKTKQPSSTRSVATSRARSKTCMPTRRRPAATAASRTKTCAGSTCSPAACAAC